MDDYRQKPDDNERERSTASRIQQRKKQKLQKKKKRRRFIAFCTILSVLLLGLLYAGSLMMGGLEERTPHTSPIVPSGLSSVEKQEEPSWEGFNDLAAAEGLERKKDYYTFLLVGKSEGNSDTILLASFDTENGAVNILQIPRDTRLAVERKIKKINYTYAAWGVDGLKSAISDLLGVPVDRYVVINTEGFRKFVDEIDGVTVEVPEGGLHYVDPFQDLVIDIPEGTQHLNGEQAEGFVRFREGYANKDLGRLQAQRAFLSAVIAKIKSPAMFFKIPGIMRVVDECVSSDMSFEDIAFLGGQALSLSSDSIKFFVLPGEGVGADYGLYKADTMALINENFNPYTSDIPESLFHINGVEKTNNKHSDDLDGEDLDAAQQTKIPSVH